MDVPYESSPSDSDSEYGEDWFQFLEEDERCNKCNFLVNSFGARGFPMMLSQDFAENCIYSDVSYAWLRVRGNRREYKCHMRFVWDWRLVYIGGDGWEQMANNLKLKELDHLYMHSVQFEVNVFEVEVYPASQ